MKKIRKFACHLANIAQRKYSDSNNMSNVDIINNMEKDLENFIQNLKIKK